jgi:acyl-CoA synthetase (NDP forming)
MSDFETMVNSKIIALIGANEKDGSVGKVILENLLLLRGEALRLARKLGFSREILPPGETRITLKMK